MEELDFLGIDTSNYTTSMAIVSCENNGDIIDYVSKRKVLYVKAGKRGLRQSEAHFEHTKNLPYLSEALYTGFKNKYGRFPNIRAVGYSSKPRNASDSYMPCFVAGECSARLAADALNVPALAFSHQCMHIASALYSADRMDLWKKRHLAYHVSGGTTELLLVNPDENTVFDCEIIGKTLDISAGQLIDRVGVLLGLGFPCGAELEQIASDSVGKVRLCIKGTDMNLSGTENICTDMLSKGIGREDVAGYCIETVKQALFKTTENALELYPGLTVVYAGGVSGNKSIREFISSRIDCAFASNGLSSDNAVGTALLAAKRYIKE